MDPETEMSIEQLKEITDDFSKEIGNGSFGVVFEGKLDGKPVAVKKLKDSSTAHDKEFRKEVEILTKVDHENIVKLIGYCCSKQDKSGSFGFPNVVEKFLCFEYASKGSLDKHIYGEPSKLGWPIRFQIIKGICRGLQALHEQKNPIVHSDLNPSNILLDDNMKPKIADFGLSKLFGAEQTHTHRSTSRSAIQYMSPEYLQGSLSIKSDIYSLGLLILVTTTGEEIRCDAPDFIRKVRKVWTTEKHIASKYVAIGAEGLRQVKGCIGVGLRCVETKQDKRPSSREVVRMVEGSGESSLLSKVFGRG